MKQVKIAWNQYASLPASIPLSYALSPADFAAAVQRAKDWPHPTLEIKPGVILEIPSSEWGHGDFLVYLPERNWTVRRNRVDYWYIDIGLTRKFTDGVWGWTDLWLDVIVPKSADRYRVVDVDEFAAAMRSDEICRENAALALDSLNALLTVLDRREFPIAEVKLAEACYEKYKAEMR